MIFWKGVGHGIFIKRTSLLQRKPTYYPFHCCNFWPGPLDTYSVLSHWLVSQQRPIHIDKNLETTIYHSKLTFMHIEPINDTNFIIPLTCQLQWLRWHSPLFQARSVRRMIGWRDWFHCIRKVTAHRLDDLFTQAVLTGHFLVPLDRGFIETTDTYMEKEYLHLRVLILAQMSLILFWIKETHYIVSICRAPNSFNRLYSENFTVAVWTTEISC